LSPKTKNFGPRDSQTDDQESRATLLIAQKKEDFGRNRSVSADIKKPDNRQINTTKKVSSKD